MATTLVTMGVGTCALPSEHGWLLSFPLLGAGVCAPFSRMRTGALYGAGVTLTIIGGAAFLLATEETLLGLYGPLGFAVVAGLLVAWRVWGKGRTLKFICIGTSAALLAFVIGWPVYLYASSEPHYDHRGVQLILGWYFFSLPAALCGAIAGYVLERTTRSGKSPSPERSASEHTPVA